jgi:hypothetical protein
LFTIAFAVAPAGVLIPLALEPHPFTVDPGGPHSNGWQITAMTFGGIGVFCLAMLLLAAILRFRRDRSAWSLQIGPPGIRTDSGLGRREYRWNQVQTFAIEEVVGDGGNYRCSAGLHIKFIKGDKRSYLDLCRPAGWPFPQRAIRHNAMVPVCVLGPMTDKQRTALREALARYGHGKSDTEAWGE